jgi:hypothetical protein
MEWVQQELPAQGMAKQHAHLAILAIIRMVVAVHWTSVHAPMEWVQQEHPAEETVKQHAHLAILAIIRMVVAVHWTSALAPMDRVQQEQPAQETVKQNAHLVITAIGSTALIARQLQHGSRLRPLLDIQILLGVLLGVKAAQVQPIKASTCHLSEIRSPPKWRFAEMMVLALQSSLWSLEPHLRRLKPIMKTRSLSSLSRRMEFLHRGTWSCLAKGWVFAWINELIAHMTSSLVMGMADRSTTSLVWWTVRPLRVVRLGLVDGGRIPTHRLERLLKRTLLQTYGLKPVPDENKVSLLEPTAKVWEFTL